MPTPRAGLASVWVNNKLYAMGGYDGKNFLKTVEIYDPKTNSWTTGPSMNSARERFVAGAINKQIYAVAGRGPSNLDIVERLDPSSSSPSWQILDSRVNTNRSSFAGVTYGNRILIFGGESDTAISVVEDLLVDTMEWRCRKNMPIGRHGMTAAVASTLVYLIGGGTEAGLSSSNINQGYLPSDILETTTCQKSTRLVVNSAVTMNVSWLALLIMCIFCVIN
jgi:N-acetylneuraminic acid mutarotase